MKEIQLQVHSYKLLFPFWPNESTHDFIRHVQLTHTVDNSRCMCTASQTSLLSYLAMPDAPRSSLFLWGAGVYSRRPGLCRQLIQPINVSAVIPSDSFWGFIVRWTVNSVEGTQGHGRRTLMVCLSRLCFKQPNVFPTSWNTGIKQTMSREFIRKYVLSSSSVVLVWISYLWWSLSIETWTSGFGKPTWLQVWSQQDLKVAKVCVCV